MFQEANGSTILSHNNTMTKLRTDEAARGALTPMGSSVGTVRGHLAGNLSAALILHLSGAEHQMFRAAKVFTKVTCVFTSASLLLASLWLFLLSRALWRCLSSCRFFFSSRCCSLRCLFVTWKRRVGHWCCETMGYWALLARTEKTSLRDQNNFFFITVLLKYTLKCMFPS